MPNTIRIQAVLNRNYFRESPALEVYNNLIKKDWTERKIITESLIALGEKLDTGWQVAEMPNEAKISSDLLMAFERLSDFVNMLTSMDITQLRQVQGFDENVYNTLKAEGLKRGASRMLSDETTFDEKESDW